MGIKVDELHKDHNVVRAAHEMVHSHGKHETLLPALYEVREQFPDVSTEVLIGIWLGVNAVYLEK